MELSPAEIGDLTPVSTESAHGVTAPRALVRAAWSLATGSRITAALVVAQPVPNGSRWALSWLLDDSLLAYVEGYADAGDGLVTQAWVRPLAALAGVGLLSSGAVDATTTEEVVKLKGKSYRVEGDLWSWPVTWDLFFTDGKTLAIPLAGPDSPDPNECAAFYAVLKKCWRKIVD